MNDIEQGTKEWEQVRLCKITGTKLKKVMGTINDRVELIAELIAEEGTQQSKHFASTEDMRRGTAEEPLAIKAFEKQKGITVDSVGFCVSYEFDFLGLSPDGFIKDSSGEYTQAVEIKNPNSSTLIKYKLANMIDEKELGLTPAKKPFLGIPAQYKWQVIDYFIVNEKLKKLYFVTYDERFISNDMKLYIVEVNRDNEILQDEMNRAKEMLKSFRETWLSWKEIVMSTSF